jgi:hypothetical protein
VWIRPDEAWPVARKPVILLAYFAAGNARTGGFGAEQVSPVQFSLKC